MQVIISGLPAAIASDVSRFVAQLLPESPQVAIVEPDGLAGALAHAHTLITLASFPLAAQLDGADTASFQGLLVWLRPPAGAAPPKRWPHTQVIALPCHLSQIAAALTRPGLGPVPLNAQWVLDMTRAAVLDRSEEHPAIELTEKEAALLSALISAAPASIARETLLADIWQYQEGVDTHTLETHIYRLRSKLAPIAEVSITNSDEGYRFQH